MTSMAVCNNLITIAKGLHIDHYDGTNHTFIDIPLKNKHQETDSVSDIIISADSKYLALITSTSKQLLVYELPLSDKCKTFELPRSASKIRFTSNNEQILVADKSGDALLYDISSEDKGTKLLGHLSLLLDILQTNNSKFIITSDRDEKIKVSCYPNTYSIQTYCLGHKEFVNHIELLPHNDNYLISTSGDGHVKCWNYVMGSLCHSIDTFQDVNDASLKEKFTEAMDTEGVEVSTLPIVHCTMTLLSDTTSLLALVVHSYNKILLYKLQTVDKFSHQLIEKLETDRFPAAIKFHESSLYVYDDVDSCVSVYSLSKDDNVIIKHVKKVKMFENKVFDVTNENSYDNIKVLYKRKFDNVQEYHERKKQRLDKSNQLEK